MLKIIINNDKCNGCGECVEACNSLPYGLPDICSLKNCPDEDCLGNKCEKIRELAVLKIQNGKVMVNNSDECNGCWECMYACGLSAIFIKDDRPRQSMCPTMQSVAPFSYCYYCDNFNNFDACITCEGKDCANCDFCKNCEIDLQALTGPWFTFDGQEIK